MPYSIEEIEDAVINLLEPLKAELGVKTIKSYQGELEEEDFKKMIVLFPSIFIVYGGSRYDDLGARKMENITFGIFACDRSLRGEQEARRGGVNNPGTYAMLRGVRDILLESTPVAGLLPIQVANESAVFFGKGISVYSAEYLMIQPFLKF